MPVLRIGVSKIVCTHIGAARLLTPLILLAGACTEGRRDDSSRIGTSPTSAPSTPQLHADLPLVRAQLDLQVTPRLGSGFTLAAIFALAVDDAQRIYVLDDADQTIHVYDTDGTPRGRIGRKGSGPGEFQRATSLSARSDSLWVIERGSGRITTFSISTGVANTFTLLPKTRGRGSPLAAMADGYLVAVTDPEEFGGRSPVGNNTTRRRSRYVRVDKDGTVRATLGTHDYSTGLTFTMRVVGGPPSGAGGGSTISREQPFFAYPLRAVSHDGTSFIDVVQVLQDQGRTGWLLLSSISVDGDTVWSKRVSFEPVPVSKSDIDQMIDSLSRPIQGPRQRLFAGDAQMIADSLYRGLAWPAATAVLAGLDGTIWLKQGGPPTTSVFYYQLSATGDVERRVELPDGFTLMQASRTTLWGWRTDEDEVPVVERYTTSGVRVAQ